MKNVLITGASRGIGAEIAKKFANEGYNVMINYNQSEENALQVKKDILSNNPNTSVEIYHCDVSDYSQCEKMLNYFLSIFGKIDVLVCNAAISLIKPLIDVSLNDYHAVMETNFGGVFNMSKLAYIPMLHQENGTIIFISSMWANLGASCESVYSASKGAIESFAKSLQKELAYSNVKVKVFAPGFVDTEMNANFSQKERQEIIQNCPLKRAETVQEVAEKVFQLTK